MPYVRFSRDKRGYENTYLVETITRRGKPSRTKILYWYRSPPGIRVGRTAFDEDVRHSLEKQYPGIRFDWKAIVSTPMPPPEPEPWWEKRRAERAAKQARRADDLAAPEEPRVEAPEPPEPVDRAASDAEIAEVATFDATSERAETSTPIEARSQADSTSQSRPADPAIAGSARPEGQGRRRRRGGRRRRGRHGGAPGPGGPDQVASAPESPADQIPESAADEAEDPPSSSEG